MGFGRLKKDDKLILLIIILFSLAIRILFWGINSAEYTDGIVQITLFENENKFWPPVYTCLIKFLELFGIDGISAGKIISISSGVLTIIPIFLLSFRLWDRRTAIFSAILFSIAPMSLRWNVRVMTDSLFVFLSTLIFYLCFITVVSINRESENISDTPLPNPPPQRGDGSGQEGREGKGQEKGEERVGVRVETVPFSIAVFLTPILILTRYQGIIFLPFILFCYIFICKSRKRIEILPIISLISFLLIFIWLKYRGIGHSVQFVERAGTSLTDVLKNYATVFESFIAYMPFFLTYPVFILMIYAFCKEDFSDSNKKFLLYFTLYYFFGLLILQTMFQSFQERYFYPIVPFVSIFAGRGIDFLIVAIRFIERTKRRINATATIAIRYILIILSFTYIIILGLAVLYFQRDAFGDLRKSAEFLKSVEPNAVIFSNENNHTLPSCIKDKFWSGRKVELLSDDYIFGDKFLPGGSYLCLHSAYGGLNNFGALLLALKKRYALEEIYSTQSMIYPIFPDIMQEPYFHQNPLALTVKYTKQTFYSYVFRIK